MSDLPPGMTRYTGILRGHEIVYQDDEWIFVDTKLPVSETWKDRPCGSCGLDNTPEGHDGCLGTLPGVMNACCGHGEPSHAYVQFEDGSTITGEAVPENNPNHERSYLVLPVLDPLQDSPYGLAINFLSGLIQQIIVSVCPVWFAFVLYMVETIRLMDPLGQELHPFGSLDHKVTVGAI